MSKRKILETYIEVLFVLVNEMCIVRKEKDFISQFHFKLDKSKY